MSGFSSPISLDPFRICGGNRREPHGVPDGGASSKRHKKKIQSLRDSFDFIYRSFTKVNFRQPFVHTLRSVGATVDELSTPVENQRK
jgi:acyl-[acyl carrier protein]--UDP-N-acetylglucosamine O-acyltransferase